MLASPQRNWLKPKTSSIFPKMFVVFLLTICGAHTSTASEKFLSSALQKKESQPILDTDVAYCIGVAESSSLYLTNVTTWSEEHLPKLDTLPYQKSAMHSWNEIQMYSTHLARKGYFEDATIGEPILKARLLGFNETNQCFRDQKENINCQSQCQKLGGGNDAITMCVEKQCKLPPSCTAQHVSCTKVETFIESKMN